MGLYSVAQAQMCCAHSHTDVGGNYATSYSQIIHYAPSRQKAGFITSNKYKERDKADGSSMAQLSDFPNNEGVSQSSQLWRPSPCFYGNRKQRLLVVIVEAG